MNESPLPPPAEPLDVARLAKAVRFALGCILLGFAIYSMQACQGVKTYEQIFKDMLGDGPGSELPLLSVWVFKARQPLFLLSLAVPLVCLAQLFSRQVVRSFYVLGIAALILIAEAIVLHYAVSLPLAEIVQRLNAGPGV